MYWFNGILSKQPQALFDLTDRGLLLGDGVFDTALVLNRRMVFGGLHLDRLTASLDAFGIAAAPLDIARAPAALCAAADPLIAYSLRITVTRGPGPRGLAPPWPQKPTILASLTAARPELFFASLALGLSPIRRNESSPSSQHKTLACPDAILANRQAAAGGFDEALFLNTSGCVACAATGNIFGLFEKVLRTPKLSDGVLPGIMRAKILRLAPELNLEIHEETLTLGDILQADAVFLTNSLRLMAPVTRIGETPFQPELSRNLAALRDRLWREIQSDCAFTESPSIKAQNESWNLDCD